MLAGGFFDLLEVVLPSVNCSLILSIQEGEEEVGKRGGTEVAGRLPEASGPCPWLERDFHWAVEMPQ